MKDEHNALSKEPLPAPTLTRSNLAQVKLSTGRMYLNIAGLCVAVEADPCREIKYPGNQWNEKLLERAAETINADVDALLRAREQALRNLQRLTDIWEVLANAGELAGASDYQTWRRCATDVRTLLALGQLLTGPV